MNTRQHRPKLRSNGRLTTVQFQIQRKEDPNRRSHNANQGPATDRRPADNTVRIAIMIPVNDNANRILTMVRQIPVGRVATYGQIAKLAGIPRNSRQVGRVLKQLPSGSDVPWFRVVNSKGEISDRDNSDSRSRQRFLLMKEGVDFSDSGRISLIRFGWEPDRK